MNIHHCKVIQENNCVLFYRYNRALNGYEIAGLIICPTMRGRIDFKKVWNYFVKEIVKTDDIYCTFMVSFDNWIMKKCAVYYKTINNIPVYKILKKTFGSPNIES